MEKWEKHAFIYVESLPEVISTSCTESAKKIENKREIYIEIVCTAVQRMRHANVFNKQIQFGAS